VLFLEECLENRPALGLTASDAPLPHAAILSQKNLSALFWPSVRPDFFSAWHGHVSFGHWVVQEAKPRKIVELGTHNGVSFASFCNAVKKCSLDAKCFAIDTWQGDEHAGAYGEEVFSNLEKFQRQYFPDISTLVRSYFDDACRAFENGSIDLLHIDGLHTYEAVKHDFETWLPKLSERALVLFHDTAIQKKGFGVWKLWEELTQIYPGFQFEHSAGLGVLAVGAIQPQSLQQLCFAEGSFVAEEIRKCFQQASELSYRAGKYNIDEHKESLLREISSKGENIALNCKATQSSYYETSRPTAENAVNGIKTGKYGFHTKYEKNPWWMVDLGTIRPFDEIVIYNRLDGSCPARARFISAFLSDGGVNWTELYSHDGTIFGGSDGFPLRINCSGKSARFIKLQLKDTQFFHIDEVEIYKRG